MSKLNNVYAVEVYEDFIDLRNELKRVITKDSVFVCIGTHNADFDAFGPLCGTLLESHGVPYYGSIKHNVNGVNMNARLNQIYKLDKIDNKNIIAIDACVTDADEKLNKISVRHYAGVKPGAALNKKFPIIGEKSIIMFTLLKKDLNETMHGYKNKEGNKTDKCDMGKINLSAVVLTDLIANVYKEVCAE